MGTFLGIVALLITLVAFIPLLGFLNWVAIPISVIFLIICAILKSDNGKTLCIVSIVLGILRLMLDILISYETMKTVYKSKVDKGLLIAIIAIVLLSYLPLLFEFSWIALALLVVTAAFIADPFCNTSYTIDNGTLHIKCGIFLSSSFPIDRITKISKTNSCLSAPALSMDRIEIRFADKKTLVLSPKQRQAFIDHLRSLNPDIVVKPPL